MTDTLAGESCPVARPRVRETLLLAAMFAAYWPVTLAADTAVDLAGQIALGLSTWTFLILALRRSPPVERIQVVAMVAVATGFECLASLLLGAYRYRLDNLPLFVPPGHGLFFLMAVRVAGLPWLERHRRAIILSVLGGSVLLLVRGLWLLPIPDLFGFGTWVVLAPYLLGSRSGLLYAVSFTMTMALEFYGTTAGNWAWSPSSPILGLPTANPPAAIGAGYCIMDGLARLLAPHLAAALGSVRGLLSGAFASLKGSVLLHDDSAAHVRMEVADVVERARGAEGGGA